MEEQRDEDPAGVEGSNPVRQRVERCEGRVQPALSRSADGRSLIMPWTPSTASSWARWSVLTGQLMSDRTLPAKLFDDMLVEQPLVNRDAVETECVDATQERSKLPSRADGLEEAHVLAARERLEEPPAARAHGDGSTARQRSEHELGESRVPTFQVEQELGFRARSGKQAVGARAAARTGSQVAIGPRGSAAGRRSSSGAPRAALAIASRRPR